MKHSPAITIIAHFKFLYYKFTHGEEAMKRCVRFWIALSALIPLTAWGMPPDYEPRTAARPLTLPERTFEVGAGVTPGNPPYYWSSFDSFLRFRYGITDNFEFIPVGLKYRILNDGASNTEATIAFCIPQFSYSRNSGTASPGDSWGIATSAKGEIKHTMLDGGLALHGLIQSFDRQRYGDTGGVGDTAYVYEGGGGIAYSFIPWASITIDAYYQKINAGWVSDLYPLTTVNETVEVVLGVLGLEYNTSRFDLRAEYFYSGGRGSFHSGYNYRDYGKSGYSASAVVRF